MTIVVTADDNTLEQVRKQLGKLVEVVKIRDFTGTSYVERDLLLLTVNAGPEKRSEVIEIVSLFRGHVVDVARDSLMVELAGTEEKLEACMELLKPHGIEELVRTGVIAMARGEQKNREKPAAKAPAQSKRACAAASAATSQALPPS